MTRALAEIKTDAGTVKFDIDDTDITGVGPQRVSRKGDTLIAELDQSLEQALASTRPAAQAVLDTFRTISPDHISIEFGLRLDASAGAVIAKAGIEAHFNITLNWTPKPNDPTPSAK
jgi:hypothetical protein